MNGAIGSIYVGERQMGGFVSWSQETLLADLPTKDGNIKHKLTSWKVEAKKYWTFDLLPPKVLIRLYLGDVYWEGEGFIQTPVQKIYDCLINEPIEIVGEKPLEGKR